jgi:hypothetical protein
MANTPVYGWETPDDTDYVYQGAAAARTTANAIDSTVSGIDNAKVAKAGDTMSGPLVVQSTTGSGRGLGVKADASANHIIQFLDAAGTTQDGYISVAGNTLMGLNVASNGNTMLLNNLGETTRTHNSVTRPMPFAQQAGAISIGASTSALVTLASGRFTVTPLVFITPFQNTNAGVVVTGKVSSVSAGAIEITNTTASTVVFYWQAIQMTSTSAAG